MLCSVLLGREGPHPLLYFRPFSNYTLTLVIYIMSLIAKCRYWRCWEALGPVPARPRLGRWHPPVALVRSCWSSPAASQHLASAPPETALESRTQVSREARSHAPRASRQSETVCPGCDCWMSFAGGIVPLLPPAWLEAACLALEDHAVLSRPPQRKAGKRSADAPFPQGRCVGFTPES